VATIYRHMRRLNARLAATLKRGRGPTGTVLVLTTTGRRTGLPRDTPLQFEDVDGVVHVASARGTAADWFRNVVADPHVTVTLRGRTVAAVAEPITDPVRIADVLEHRLRTRPVMVRLIMTAAEGLPLRYSRADLERIAAGKALVALRGVETAAADGAAGAATDGTILACPRCRGPLGWDAVAASHTCAACARSYPVRDGITHFIEPGDLGPRDRRFARLYDWFSWVYAAFSRAGFALIGMSEARGRREVLDRLDPRGGRVLEVSVGPGSNLPYLMERGDVGEVHALDISMGQLRRCRALIRRRGWTVPLYLASAEALPFRDATFDAVLHIGGINFFDDKARALAEMARVAKPGVRVVVADEKERGAQAYERILPGFRRSFRGGRPPVSAPLGDVPPGMRDVTVSDIWRGWFYCLEFVTPPAPPPAPPQAP